jgi:hypothetical protein
MRESLIREFETNPSMAMALCGYGVQGLMRVRVTNVASSGTDAMGSGSANVSGNPIALVGMPREDGPCSGLVTFQYFRSTRLTGGSRTGTVLQVYNMNVANRTGAVPVHTVMPTAPGTSTTATGATPGVIPLQVGGVVNGSLVVGDTALPNGRVADEYAVGLMVGQPLTVVARGGPSISTPGSTLDVYLEILQNGTELAHDDDSAGYPNSRIVFTAPRSGVYTVRVTTFGSSLRQGAYTLQSWPFAFPSAR